MQYKSNMVDVLKDIEKDYIKKFDGQTLNMMMNDITAGILRTMKRRIHSDGMDIYNRGIGTYSTDPMYANPSNGAVRVALANKGKYGDTHFKNGKPHKTRYYSDGYKGWRTANRRKTNKVDLVFKGDLERSFTFQQLRPNVWGIGFTDNENWQKAKGLEQHFTADIWGIGTREQEIIDKTIDAYLKKL